MKLESRTEVANTNKSSISSIQKSCSKSCVECLTCPHNKNAQFNLILMGLFNTGKDIREVGGFNLNSGCDLK